MSKFIVTGDVHAHPYAGPVNADGSNRRLADIIACLDAMRLHAYKAGIPDIVVAGDLFHDRKGVRPEVLHRVGEWLSRCHTSKIAVTVLLGNHDLSIGGDGCTSIMALLKAATVITTGCVKVIGGVKVGFIPYTDDAKDVKTLAKSAANNGAKVLIGHVGIGDPKYSACVPTDYEVPGKINVADLLPNLFEQVYLGHYHRAQTLLPNLHYVGSPLQLSFKEVGQAKSFVVHTPGKKPALILNNTSPRFHKKTAAEILAHPDDVSADDYVTATTATRDEEMQLREKFGERETALRIERRVTSDVTERIDVSGSEAETLAAFAKLRRPDLSQRQLEELVAAGSTYLQHAAKG